ncbi:YerC/YecD family TrpR-related protein [Lysobacter panacisoli]|uniref:YerC/YecD family TrpR-related protein n=1 Tax=Lysobacter panacisoli TaxID=1255263 RepID=A0ABP9LR17_9GAMM|nr:YerC/YecD family TrpR-related protein [Lysobacter panacisoli]
MKRRPTANERSEENLAFLAAALLELRTAEEVQAFLEDLCTPAELEAMSDRWRVVPLLQDGVPYREIHDRTQVSVTTIGRVARTLERGAGGYRIAAGRVAAPSVDDAQPELSK